jgi:hypothetical protein
MYERQQFIIYRLEHSSVNTGEIKKIPLNPFTFFPHDPHDPSIWMPYEKARELSKNGFGVGFVFTEQDPYFFIDIDHCKAPDGTWSQHAVDTCTKFNGCFIEVSASGNGLHIIGSYMGQEPPHSCDNKTISTQFYTSKRFVALTWTGYRGDPTVDATNQLTSFINSYFLPSATSTKDVSWTNKPCPEWNGPQDDNELIQMMLNSKSGGSVFGGRASIMELWWAADTLGQYYPDPSGQRSFDWSSADAALCQHLAFWTGKNCERIDRLFRLSNLMRDKWENREDYRTGTIVKAVSLCNNVLTVRDRPPIVTPDPTGPGVATSEEGYYISFTQMEEYFKGCVYVRDIHKIWVPDGAMLKPEQFKAMYGGHFFALDYEKWTKNAWEAFTENRILRFPKVVGTMFRPELETGSVVQEEDRKMVNTYVPISTERKVGDWSPFVNHVKLMLPDPVDQSIIMNYMAALVQYPGYKFQWCPILQGVQGNGKSMLLTAIAFAVGWRYTHLPNASDLGGNGTKFNAWIENKLFIGIEEIYVSDRREVLEALKPYITNPKLEIQRKGLDQITGDNRANFLMCTNHKDAVFKSRNDRRFAIFYTAQQNVEDIVSMGWGGSYFKNIYEWLRKEGYAIINDNLRSFKIEEEFNPAGMCQRAPKTSSTDEAISLSVGRIEQEVIEAVEQDMYGFRGGYISSMMLDDLLSRKHIKISHHKRKEILESLGYIPHPNLKDGRVTSMIDGGVEMGKPRIYIKIGSLLANVPSGNVGDHYKKAQGATAAEVVFSEPPVNAGIK